MERGKIAEHALRELRLQLSLVFEVNEAACFALTKSGLHNKVGVCLAPAATSVKTSLSRKVIDWRSRQALNSGRNRSRNSAKNVVSSSLNSRSWSIMWAVCGRLRDSRNLICFARSFSIFGFEIPVR